MERLFVYGTLAPGQVNYHVVAHIPGTWQPATLRGHLLDAGWGAQMGCPGIVPGEDGDAVPGEVLSSEALVAEWAMLDAFEGDGYTRVPVKVTLESGESVAAYVYALSGVHT